MSRRPRVHNSDKKTLKVFQANVGKIPPAHDCALALADSETYDVVLLQEPWTEAKNSRCLTKTHPAYDTYSPVDSWDSNGTRPRVMTYIRKDSRILADQKRPALTRDILWLTVNGVTVVNFYRQPHYDVSLDVLLRWSAPEKTLVAGDFNAKHYSWQTGRLEGRGEDIATWAAENGLNLLNTADEPTNPHGNTIDLAFSNIALASAVVEDHLATSSDHFTLGLILPDVGLSPPRVPGKVRVTTDEELKRFKELVAAGAFNGYTSEQRELPQAGLPQGSPLSPILFLFFNADLVQRRIKAEGGSIAFVDDYSAWVTGPTAEANREGIQAIIDDALKWEARSGATFEADKTTIVHFTRATVRNSDKSFLIRGQEVRPKKNAKILGVIMDDELRFQEHMMKAAASGLSAAMGLRRLKMLSPRVSRQLFEATVAPAMDYASNVWTHAVRAKHVGWMNKAQMIGAQAITGAFRTVAKTVAMAEANIRTVGERHRQATTRLCINLQTLPMAHPLAALRNCATRRFVSPMQKIVTAVLPQGSPVSPILFLLYTEPIYRLGNPEGRFGYADDTAILCVGQSLEQTSQKASEYLQELVNWGAANGISFDPEKTEVMHFSPRRRETKPPVRHGDVEKRPETAMRWLGLWLDRKLTFKTHVEKWTAKAQAVANHLRSPGSIHEDLCGL
ncbi:hypothetical protein HIM_10980 [Hirsutella minnesotensis 3608]|uniref:Reverse transcriptase domain-containing protein n=1 Tax=Hirsutella minnesotensis 3608 TaxID=1043627 RepID=A0A0F7ZFS3_9HYPO|nr:hypothetical protein HIM_10980 [Hirsutella minnesotensis 3608]